jgi:hypothetical protein
MKKLLLFVLALGFVSIGIAQVSQYKPSDWYSTVTKKANHVKVAEQLPTYTMEVNPTVANLTGSREADLVIGETKYDLQSNSSMAQRLIMFDDGTMAATWTRGMNDPNYADRGTGYNYFDGTSWGEYPTERVEDTRTGWPSIAPYGANGEIICSHTGGVPGLQFSWRENKGEGEWNYFQLAGPDAQKDLLWPRMITSGENHDVIHVIAAAGNAATYEGLTMALLYSRSTDGGQTWDPKNVILEGMGTDYTSGFGGDDYAWAAPVGNTIAFVAFSGVKDGIVMKSTDGGDEWERIVFYESPFPFFTGNEGTLPKCGGGDGYNAIVIDDEEMIHVAFGRQIHLDDDPADGWSYYPYSDGLVYWNETMDPLDTSMIQADILPADWSEMYLYQNGNLAAWTQEHGEDTIVGVAPYYASLTSMPQLVATRDANNNKIIQVFYGAVSVGFSIKVNEVPLNYRHIWGRYTEGDGMFSEFVDYTGDADHFFNESVYPSVAQNTQSGAYEVLYLTDFLPGNSLQPDPPTHTPVLNNMVLMEVSPLAVDVNETPGQSFDVSQNFPNPFTGETYFTVNLNKGSNLALDVFTLTGQKVSNKVYGQLSAGTHKLSIDANNLPSGVYFYTITAGDSKVTRKMIVE